MSADRIDDLSTLADEHVARSEDYSRSLLRLTLDCHETHRGALCSLADRFGIGSVILLALDEGLHVSWRYQPDRMPELADLATPVVRARAGFHRHKAWRLCGEIGQYLPSSQLLAEHDGTGGIRTVSLKDVLGQIQADGGNV
jgi:hypothetical protein